MEKIEEITPFGLRMRSTLKSKIDAAAAYKKKHVDRRWSANSEIVDRLEKSFVPPREIKDYSDGELIDELTKRLGKSRVTVRVEIDKPGGGSEK